MKKKLLILSSSGGGGHTSASAALTDILKNEYDIICIDTFTILLGNIDMLKFFSRGAYSFTELYNTGLRKRLFRFINIFVPIGLWFLKILHPYMRKNLKQIIEKNHIDIVVSVIPFINGEILNVAQKENIPFVLIPTDFNPETYLYNFDKTSYKKFYFAQVLSHSRFDTMLSEHGIFNNHHATTGFIAKPDFFEEKNRSSIKTAYHLPTDKPIILCMLGAAGSNKAVTIAQEICHIELPMHVIFCIGRNTTIKAQLEKIQRPAHITFSIIDFTKDIASLMAISDIFITKSGPNSIYEAMIMNLPMIIDAEPPLLFWEKYNPEFVKEQGFGLVAQTVSEIQTHVTTLLSDASLRTSMKEKMRVYPIIKNYAPIKTLIDTAAHDSSSS